MGGAVTASDGVAAKLPGPVTDNATKRDILSQILFMASIQPLQDISICKQR